MIKEAVGLLTKNYTESKNYEYYLDEGAYLVLDSQKPLKEQLVSENLVVVTQEKNEYKTINRDKEQLILDRLPFIFSKLASFESMRNIEFSLNYFCTSYSLKNLYFLISKEYLQELSELTEQKIVSPKGIKGQQAEKFIFSENKAINSLIKKEKLQNNPEKLFDLKGNQFNFESISTYLEKSNNKNYSDFLKESPIESEPNRYGLSEYNYEWLFSEQRQLDFNKVKTFFELNSESFKKDLMPFLIDNLITINGKETISKITKNKFFTIIFKDISKETYEKESLFTKEAIVNFDSKSGKYIIKEPKGFYQNYPIVVTENTKAEKPLSFQKSTSENNFRTTFINHFQKMEILKFFDFIYYNFSRLNIEKQYFRTVKDNGVITRQLLLNTDGSMNNKQKDGLIIGFSKEKSGLKFLNKQYYTPNYKKEFNILFEKNIYSTESESWFNENTVIINESDFYREINSILFSNCLNQIDYLNTFDNVKLKSYIIKYKNLFNQHGEFLHIETFNKTFHDLLFIHFKDGLHTGFNELMGNYRVPSVSKISNGFNLLKSLTNYYNQEDYIVDKELLIKNYKNKKTYINNREDLMFVIGNLANILISESVNKSNQMAVVERIYSGNSLEKSINVLNDMLHKYSYAFSDFNKKRVKNIMLDILTYYNENNSENKLTIFDKNNINYGILSEKLKYDYIEKKEGN